MNQLFMALLTFLLLRPDSAFEEPRLKAIDLFGTDQITAEQIRNKLGDKIRQYVAGSYKIGAGAYSQDDFNSWVKVQDEIVSEIKRMGKFAYVELSAIYYFHDKSYYLTVDVVDEADRSTRLSFSPPPMKEFPDPDGLMALWEEYETASSQLAFKGELHFNKDMPCPALHCTYGFEHSALKKYAEPFQTRVPKNKGLLIRILREDRDEQHRGRAAFLLAHLKDPAELVQILLPSISDASGHPRNNVMRVLGEIAEKRKNVTIPLEPIIKALNYPATTDRNKALYVLDGLADNPKNKGIIIDQAGRQLIKLLKLSQPNNHDFAYSILKKVGGKNYAERDYAAWERWIKEAQGRKH